MRTKKKKERVKSELRESISEILDNLNGRPD
jgi:hypothetical protein